MTAGRLRAARVLIALAAAAACAGAVVAYAATRPSGVQRGLGGHHSVKQPSGSGKNGPRGKGSPSAPSRERLLQPRLIETPAETTTTGDPQFRFHVPPRNAAAPAPAQPGEPPAATSSRRFQCQVDGAGWSECRSPYPLTGLAPGPHRFAVRVFNREERVGEPVGFEWRQTAAAPAAVSPSGPVEARPFSIVALQQPKDLFPGLAPTPIPIRITNPNDVAIEVTGIAAAVQEAPPDCAAENFELIPAGVSPQQPLLVPANDSVELPIAGAEAPAIKMLNLSIEQDACRGAEIPLLFSGEAQG